MSWPIPLSPVLTVIPASKSDMMYMEISRMHVPCTIPILAFHPFHFIKRVKSTLPAVVECVYKILKCLFFKDLSLCSENLSPIGT